MRRAGAGLAVLAAAALVLAGCGGSGSPHRTATPSSTQRTTERPRTPPAPSSSISSSTSATATTTAPAALPRPAHIVVVVMENRAYDEIIGNRSAPYLNRLASTGALFTQSFATRHPSEPNYLALFSGSTQGLGDDSCPHSYRGPNLAAQLIAAGKSFTGYAEGLPSPGYTGCSHGEYARKHVPWVNFSALPAAVNQPFSAFPTDYARLPTVAFVIPDRAHDMHDGTIAQGDRWLDQHLRGYETWARTHNSLLVITWDEDDNSGFNHIPTIITGAHVRAGHYGEHLTHYRLLRTVEALERLAPIGAAARIRPATDIWTPAR